MIFTFSIGKSCIYIILFQNNNSCQNHPWCKKYVNAFAVPIRLVELLSASTFGMLAKLTNLHIFFVILAAGHGALLSSLTAS